jgi:hypothetical protein
LDEIAEWRQLADDDYSTQMHLRKRGKSAPKNFYGNGFVAFHRGRLFRAAAAG